jgi:hypothetical protein
MVNAGRKFRIKSTTGVVGSVYLSLRRGGRSIGFAERCWELYQVYPDRNINYSVTFKSDDVTGITFLSYRIRLRNPQNTPRPGVRQHLNLANQNVRCDT